MHKVGDSEAMNKIVSENVGLIWNVVRRFNNRGYELDDLFQIGSIGLVKAIKAFDVTFETKLSTYAVSMIIGEIKRFLRDDGMIKVSRHLKEIAGSIRELQRNELDKDFSINEISEKLGVEKNEIIMALDATNTVESLDRKINDDDGKSIGETIALKKDEYEKIVDKLTAYNMLEILEEREKRIIIYRYFREMTQSQIANIYGTSQVQISRIEKRALEKMRKS